MSASPTCSASRASNIAIQQMLEFLAIRTNVIRLAKLIITTLNPSGSNLGEQLSSSGYAFGRRSNIKTSASLIIRLDEIFCLIPLERCSTKQSLFRRIIRLVPVVILSELPDAQPDELTLFA